MARTSTKPRLLTRIGWALLGQPAGGSKIEERHDARVRARISVQVKTSYGQAQMGLTSNLSLAGMFVEAENVPTVGSEVTLIFLGPPQDPAPIRVVARVVWTSLQGRKGMGLQVDRRATAATQWCRYCRLLEHYLQASPAEEPRRARSRAT